MNESRWGTLAGVSRAEGGDLKHISEEISLHQESPSHHNSPQLAEVPRFKAYHGLGCIDFYLCRKHIKKRKRKVRDVVQLEESLPSRCKPLGWTSSITGTRVLWYL